MVVIPGLEADPEAGPVLQTGRNAWRIARAERAAVLVDGACYFGALRRALRNAERTIYIVGWDINSRTRLVGENGETGDDLPETLGDFLCALVRIKPRLSIKLLLWDYSVVYSLEREPLPFLALQWRTPPQIELCLDDVLPAGSSQHQKIVVVDDRIAFSGGLDLTVRRWDSSSHAVVEPGRVDPAGAPYPPFHDVQMLVDGLAAQALAELVRERWAHAACERLPSRVRATGDPWPAHIRPDFRGVDVALSRTQPEAEDRTELREVETLYLDMISAARRSIYIENQFVTSANIAHGLAAALRERPQLEVLIVMPRTHTSWIGERAMLAGRRRFLEILRVAAPPGRVRVVHPQVVEGDVAVDVMVHSKLMIVDDRLLRIGSANLCNRSMGTDTECDLTIEAADSAERRAIRAVRDRMLAEHCGVDPDEMGAQIERTGSMLATIGGFEGRAHRLVDMGDPPAAGEEILVPVEALADPERPISIAGLIGANGGVRPARRIRTVAKLGVALAAVVLILLLWRYADLQGLAGPGVLEGLLTDIAEDPLAPVAVVALFVCAGLVGFPVTVLIAATAVSFGAWPGLPYAAAGALASATVTYGVGAWLGAGFLRRLFGPRLNRIRRGIARRGILAITAVRLVPVAPFTLVNLVAGALKVSLWDYLIGTALGLVPGLAAMSVLGDRLARVFTDPTLFDAGVLVAVLVVWLGLSIGLQAQVTRARRRRR
jgi:phosphatidylserine/phosphatidylglycerophosphate/cardiolipin synthase-like enzyme/uncharacterized membrane protein YdjX (TVP38/TMEM64 family)